MHRTMALSIDDILVEPLRVRLRNLEEDHVHYEASFRGPHNTFLQSHFTVGDEYMVKPRPRLQTVEQGPSPRFHGLQDVRGSR